MQFNEIELKPWARSRRTASKPKVYGFGINGQAEGASIAMDDIAKAMHKGDVQDEKGAEVYVSMLSKFPLFKNQ